MKNEKLPVNKLQYPQKRYPSKNYIQEFTVFSNIYQIFLIFEEKFKHMDLYCN